MESLLDELLLSLSQNNCGSQILPPEKILNEIHSKFIKGSPRAWWNGLENKIEAHRFDDNSGYKALPEYFDGCGDFVFLIADDDNEEKYVFEVKIQCLTKVLEECRFFEYYVAPVDLSFLICENDHGDVIKATPRSTRD